ncbi:L,D-transpeptidase [Mesorhizobium sp. ZMM04-5]|uniref:L,D-transpeptidase n=1 Tax=Mesorhizobium marinum TaxID=3228790 RepID=A0ABV3QXM1_9HYPH
MWGSYRKKHKCKSGNAKYRRDGNRGLARLTVRAKPGNPSRGLLDAGGVVFPCALGRGGISSRKREGDGATPLGAMRLRSGYFRADQTAARHARLKMTPIDGGLGWCDRPDDRNYNRPVRLPYRGSHEDMHRADRLYDVCIVLDWNIVPRQRGRGSAIFFHLARPGFTPTQGCVAVTARVMARLLPRLSSRTVLEVKR